MENIRMFRFLRRSLWLLFPLLAGATAQLRAQDVTEVTLKGAFLFNFARFTEWPADALQADSTVAACVVGDVAVGDAFSRTVKGKRISGRPITVTTIAPGESLPTCHVLYLSGMADASLADIVSRLREVPVLTVSDAEAFSRRGGIVEMFVDAGRMKFRINARSAKRARLKLSSQLLALAEIVDEDPSVAFAHVPASPDVMLLSHHVEPLITNWALRRTPWTRN
jgi:YfiR/HmsC-like